MRVVDLFAGCGGLSKGFQEAGFDVTLAVERWQPARDVYAANFDHPVRDMDLSGVKEAVDAVRLERPDMIIGGPPCQEFSAAGNRVEGARAQLTVNFANIVKAVRPRWFVLENVQGISGSQTWSTANDVLKKAGYGITQRVLNAAHFGVPQNRKRFFAIGMLGADDDILAAQIDLLRSDDPLSVEDYLGDELGVDFYYRHPRNWGRRGVFSTKEPSPTIRSTNRPVPPGYKPHPEDAGPASQARPLTAAERARVQTFGRDFKFSGTMTDQDIMIANAVPVVLAKNVALAISRYEEDCSMLCDPEFRSWLTATRHYTPRTVSNVVSRLRRASRILQLGNLPNDPLDAIHALERKGEFLGLPSSVRSQIKKAIRLHSEYVSRR